MTRTLYLIRHAEAADKLALQSDRDRALTKNGEWDAREVGKYFLKNKIQLDAIHHSPAVRTSQTAKCINESLQLPSQRLISVDAVYHAHSEILLALTRFFDNEYSHVALIGHNPAISAYASELTIEDVPDFSPATVVAIDFEIDGWSDIEFKKGKVKFIFNGERF
jgi:phosphohistidine phosphatase